MVHVYTPNGYCISIIQTTIGNGSAVEVAFWARDKPQSVFLPCPVEGIDMMFMYSEDLVKLIDAVQKLPEKEKVY